MSTASEQSTARSKPGIDLFSNMPSELIENILGFVPLGDAVRTSALSRRWRKVWLKLPKLMFDATFGEVKAGVTSSEKLLLVMYRVLLARKAPIHELALSVPGLGSCSEIDQFAEIASEKGVRKLAIEFPNGTSHMLHSSVFSCLELTHLRLRGCNIKPPPSFKGFSNLLSLTLGGVSITADVLLNLISLSPLLEWLHIDGSAGCDILVVNSLRLKSFHCFAHFDTLIHVASPALVNVSMISNVPRGKFEEKHTMLQSVDFLHPVQTFTLDYYYLEILVKAGSNFTFKHLRILRLNGISFPKTNEVKCVLLFISNCPVLQKVRIELSPRYVNVMALGMDDVEFYKGMWEKDLSSCPLREVDMRYLTGSWPELEFMKLLLSKLLLLQTLVIHPYFKMVTDGGLGILKEVSQFPRSSPRAIVKFRDQKVKY